MRKLDGCDDRALVLENHHLSALRWGAEENRYALSELTPGSVVRHDLAIFVPLERQAEAEEFVAAVNAVITHASV
jgi:hypothetical protein